MHCAIILSFLHLVNLSCAWTPSAAVVQQHLTPGCCLTEVCASEIPHIVTNLHNQPPKASYAFVPLCT